MAPTTVPASAPSDLAVDAVYLRPSPLPKFGPENETDDWGQPSFDDADAPAIFCNRREVLAARRPAVCCECDDHVHPGCGPYCFGCWDREDAKQAAGETEEQATERHLAALAVMPGTAWS
jgi:hypothetical protein